LRISLELIRRMAHAIYSLTYRTYVACAAAVAVALIGGITAAAADKPGFAAASSATDTGAENKVDIKPYTGKPIFLDEPEAPPASSMVERIVQTDKYSDGKLHVERQVAKYSDNHFVADGFYREYYPNGQKFVDGQYKDGRQDGDWTYWHENGTLNRKLTYKDGLPDGSWDVHRADGSLMVTRSFKLGRRDGTWTYYDDTGKQPLRVEKYADGKADGEWKIWFPSGQLQRQISFKAGNRDGLAAEWDEKGNKRIEMNYVDGKPDGDSTSWTADGRKTVQHYKDGKLVPEPNQK
jgi:antitoxin component YwqK of YwqJK toxin-antitoxin module